MPAAITDSLLWAGVAAAIAAWLPLFGGTRRGDRFRLSWRARAFVITAVSVTTFLITLVWGGSITSRDAADGWAGQWQRTHDPPA